MRYIMKVAVVGSRTLKIKNIGNYIPKNTTEIVSGGAKGVDTCAREYSIQNNIKLTEFLPDYKKYGRIAPLKCSLQIIACADLVLAFWDGKSTGTKNIIDCAMAENLPCIVIKV